MNDQCNPSGVITDPEQATPEWIARVLRQGGHLLCGEVTQVRADVDSSYTSTIARLSLSYSADAPPSAPARLFLKLSRVDPAQRVVGSPQRRAEVRFHNEVVARMPVAPVARCYHAVYDEASGASHLLFDDLAATHCGGDIRTPPARPHCERAIEAFADFHAFWWDNPALREFATPSSLEEMAASISAIRACYPRFADAAGERLDARQRRAYEQVLVSLPKLMERVTSGHGITLIHGDANLSNVLLPRDPEKDRALIIDWQLWNASYAAEDLANLMALFWDGEQRRALEGDLLKRYHDRLLQHGVRGYAWADCRRDYQLAVITRVLFMPMWFWESGQRDARTWLSLEYAWQAFDDLGCRERLETP
jgi:hypothetical protein